MRSKGAQRHEHGRRRLHEALLQQEAVCAASAPRWSFNDFPVDRRWHLQPPERARLISIRTLHWSRSSQAEKLYLWGSSRRGSEQGCVYKQVINSVWITEKNKKFNLTSRFIPSSIKNPVCLFVYLCIHLYKHIKHFTSLYLTWQNTTKQTNKVLLFFPFVFKSTLSQSTIPVFWNIKLITETHILVN